MANSDIFIVDYGLGNLFNIQAAFEALGATVEISSNPLALAKAKRLVIPGVGAFVDGMKGLHEKNLVAPVQEFARSGKPILGICLGMQLMLEKSEEWGQHSGLGIVAGSVNRLKEPLPGVQYKIPHIGWNLMRKQKHSPILENIGEKSNQDFYMYFLHSYFPVLENPDDVIATTEYGRDQFCSAFQSKNIYGFQPHPERSGKSGLVVFQNFLRV